MSTFEETKTIEVTVSAYGTPINGKMYTQQEAEDIAKMAIGTAYTFNDVELLTMCDIIDAPEGLTYWKGIDINSEHFIVDNIGYYSVIFERA